MKKSEKEKKMKVKFFNCNYEEYETKLNEIKGKYRRFDVFYSDAERIVAQFIFVDDEEKKNEINN